jgi:hypothetical protein
VRPRQILLRHVIDRYEDLPVGLIGRGRVAHKKKSINIFSWATNPAFITVQRKVNYRIVDV